MEIRPLRLHGTYQILLAPLHDDRGYYMRVYDEAIFRKYDLQTSWVQENQLRSIQKHTIRGLHFQTPPHTETKLIRVVTGAILDVLVDLRRDSETFGQYDSIELSADNQKMIYVPKGFAHGFCTLTEETVVVYKVDSAYAPDFQGGLRWNDDTLRIKWPTNDPYLSVRDRGLGSFDGLVSPF